MLMLFYLGLFFFIGLWLVLCFVVLIQENKSAGFGASFGGNAGTSVFGTSTADVLKKFTAWMIVIFFISCLFFSYASGQVSSTPTIEGISIEGDVR